MSWKLRDIMKRTGPRPPDDDYPSEETIERRRQADIAFLAWVKTAPMSELIDCVGAAQGWRQVAILRRIRAQLG